MIFKIESFSKIVFTMYKLSCYTYSLLGTSTFYNLVFERQYRFSEVMIRLKSTLFALVQPYNICLDVKLDHITALISLEVNPCLMITAS